MNMNKITLISLALAVNEVSHFKAKRKYKGFYGMLQLYIKLIYLHEV